MIPLFFHKRAKSLLKRVTDLRIGGVPQFKELPVFLEAFEWTTEANEIWKSSQGVVTTRKTAGKKTPKVSGGRKQEVKRRSIEDFRAFVLRGDSFSEAPEFCGERAVFLDTPRKNIKRLFEEVEECVRQACELTRG